MKCHTCLVAAAMTLRGTRMAPAARGGESQETGGSKRTADQSDSSGASSASVCAGLQSGRRADQSQVVAFWFAALSAPAAVVVALSAFDPADTSDGPVSSNLPMAEIPRQGSPRISSSSSVSSPSRPSHLSRPHWPYSTHSHAHRPSSSSSSVFGSSVTALGWDSRAGGSGAGTPSMPSGLMRRPFGLGSSAAGAAGQEDSTRHWSFAVRSSLHVEHAADSYELIHCRRLSGSLKMFTG
jgi:hypothetical protein